MNSSVFAFSLIRIAIAQIWVRGPFRLARMRVPRLPEQLSDMFGRALVRRARKRARFEGWPLDEEIFARTDEGSGFPGSGGIFDIRRIRPRWPAGIEGPNRRFRSLRLRRGMRRFAGRYLVEVRPMRKFIERRQCSPGSAAPIYAGR